MTSHASGAAAPDPPISFRFTPAASCNMCGAPPKSFRAMGRRLNRHQGLRPTPSAGDVVASIVRCRACGLVFPDPMPVPASAGVLYGLDPEAYWPPEYFRPDPGYLRGECETAEALLGRRAGVDVLDIGAGIGKGVLALRAYGFRARGVEPSPTFRRLAIERGGLSGADMLLGSVEDVEVEPGSVDWVNFGAVLEHLPDPRGALARALTWLRPGGIVHAEVPSSRWLLGRALNLFYRVTGQGFVTNTSPMHPPFHLYEFTPRSFDLTARALGYRVERCIRWVGDVYGPAWARPLLRTVMARTGTGMQLTVWLRKT